MSAVETLQAARAAGITVMVDGETLVLQANTRPPNDLIEALSREKPAILALLHDCVPSQRRSTDAMQALHEHGNLSRRLVNWLDQHPQPSTPGRCAWCRQPETPGAVVVPFGTEPGTHTWLHAECWQPWHQARRKEAFAACCGSTEADRGR